jgi:hypothetical protein
MCKAATYLLFAVSVLVVSSRAQGEVFYTSLVDIPGSPYIAVLDPGAPPPSYSAATITGLQPAETSLGVALRPGTADLYLVGSSSRLYRLSPTTGAATPVGPPFAPALSGTAFGLAFDNADQLRIVSNTGQNLRIDPATAAVTVDTPLAYAAGDPHAGQAPDLVIAYDHRHGDATAYGVDKKNVLVRLGSSTASDGVLTTIASTPATSLVGFDISSVSGLAYGLEPGFSSELVTLDLATGASTPVAQLGNQFTYFRGLAVAPAFASVPTLGWPGLACLALSLALSALWVVRRRPRPFVGRRS